MKNETTNYYIELHHASGEEESLPIAAKNDREARLKMTEWLKANTAVAAQVYLGFFRFADGQRGYINPNGASPTGQPWN